MAAEPTKPPLNARTGGGASHSNPAHWSTFAQAVEHTYKRNLPGVGYVISEDDGYTGYDLDKCIDAGTGIIAPWAQEIVDFAETYTEISPSGRGLRLIARGKIEKTIKLDSASVEAYRAQRYLTITGNHIASTPTAILPAPRTHEALLARVAAVKAAKAETAAPSQPLAPVELTTPRVIDRTPTARAKKGDFFRNVNSEALLNFASWVPTLFPTAKRSGDGTWRVTSAALGRDLQEDLSLAPTGIIDFGVADMGDATEGRRTSIDIVLDYSSINASRDAALWLCDQMGKAPELLGFGADDADLVAMGAGIIERMSRSEPAHQYAQPLPLLPAVDVSKPFPIDALGSILAPAAKAIAYKVQVPDAMAGQSVLAAAALAAQAHADVRLPYGQVRPLSLFMATVAASGDRKSATDTEATHAIGQRETQLKRAFKDAHADWKVKAAAWGAEKRKIENNAKIDLNERQALLLDIGPEPSDPIKPILVVDDITCDGLTKSMLTLPGSLGFSRRKEASSLAATP